VRPFLGFFPSSCELFSSFKILSKSKTKNDSLFNCQNLAFSEFELIRNANQFHEQVPSKVHMVDFFSCTPSS